MSQVRSQDGTLIAYQRSGNGPALILVDGALCSRAFGPSQKVAALLTQQFTVYAYDRRGRGESGDTPPYAPAREVEDIAALIEAAGGSAVLVGLSSGGALSLEAAASGLAVTKVVAYEPPYVDDSGERGGAAHKARLEHLLADGNRGGAVKYFMKDMVGAPAPLVVMMRRCDMRFDPGDARSTVYRHLSTPRSCRACNSSRASPSLSARTSSVCSPNSGAERPCSTGVRE